MDRIYLNINSNTDRAPFGSSSKFNYNLAQTMRIGNNAKIGVQSIEVPYSCGQFKTSNSILWFEFNPSSPATIGFQLDTNKFYKTLTDVITELNSISSAHNYDLSFNVENDRLKITNNNTYKVRVVSPREFEPSTTNNISVNGSVLFSGGGLLFNQAQIKLGFYDNQIGQWITENGGTKLSTGLPKLLRSNCFYLECNILSRYMMENNRTKSPKIITKIPITSNFGSLQTIEYNNPIMLETNDTYIDSIDFTLYDEDLEEVDLNGLPITMTLVIEI